MIKTDLMSFTVNYANGYNLQSIRGVDIESRPWDLYSLIERYSDSNKRLLDVGCGNAGKIIPLAKKYLEVVGVDCSDSMISEARNNVMQSGVNNISVITGDSHNLPFSNDSFDVVTCILSRWIIPELYRVLKDKGIVIVEHVGCRDKYNLKKYFRCEDTLIERGQYLEYNENEYLTSFKDKFNKYFNILQFQNGFWHTEYTQEGVDMLLKYTPTVKNYDEHKDRLNVEKALKSLTQNCSIDKITLKQNRVLLVAIKK